MLPISVTPNTLFVVNHSGGKDSQAMFLYLRTIVPEEQLVVIHAHLPEVEWDGTVEHIQNTIGDIPFHVVRAKKTFFEMVEHRKMFPSSSNRQCTSDLKRGPINKKVVEICNSRGFDTVVNCMGIRAQESSARSKKSPFKKSRNSNSKRAWYDWYPLFTWSTKDVFRYIHENNQKPHWAYSKGMTRLSCCFCIMSSKEDLRTAALLNPDLFKKYVETERRLNHTLIMPTKSGKVFLDQLVSNNSSSSAKQLSIFNSN